MKKKLFAVAMLISVYALFALIFTSLDSQENVSFNDVGLSDATAHTTLQPGQTNSDVKLKASFRDPMPPPEKKPSRRP